MQWKVRPAGAVADHFVQTCSSTIRLFAKPLSTSAAFVLVYVLIYWLTDFLTYSDIRVSPWNPETGLTMAAGAHWGPWGALLATLARLCALTINKAVFIPTLDIPAAIVHTLVFALPIYAARRKKLLETSHQLRLVGTILVLGLLGSVFAAAFQVFLLSFVIGFQVEWILPTITTKAVGDFIGIVTVAPLFILPQHPARIVTLLAMRPFASMAALAIIGAVSYFVFALEAVDDFKFFYVI
ncbi:MAG: hypothetical protein HC855_14580, partial [Rhizobiales bacterium]|nr:hypothetical protein [Hyphomicrobiales bacterium]